MEHALLQYIAVVMASRTYTAAVLSFLILQES